LPQHHKFQNALETLTTVRWLPLSQDNADLYAFKKVSEPIPMFHKSLERVLHKVTHQQQAVQIVMHLFTPSQLKKLCASVLT
jgi:hypothetical protein